MNSGIAVPEKTEGARPNNEPPSRPRMKRWALIAVTFLAVFIALLVAVTRLRTHTANTNPHDSAAAQTSVRLTGKTQAVRSRAILAPLLAGQQVGTLTIVKLASSGIHVKQGDLLVEFDRQAQLKDFVDKKAQSDDQNGKVMEAQAAEIAAKSKDETDLEQAETALSKAELEMQKVELMSRIDAEKARQNLDEAKATLAQLKETFDLKRKAAQAAIRVLEIQRDRTLEVMVHAQTNASQMQIRSPIDGIVVLNTIWKEGTMGEVKEGDQVRPGVPFMQVVDPSMMEVHVMVNQEDLAKLTLGQSAQVHLDAYPDITLQGQLESIDPMGKPGDFSARMRNFSATFSVKGSDPRLMPDLSAAVDVQAAQQPSNLSASR
ncbi:HlyD family efflux transporter periplasmic adaptor subunit [Telmatobacter sp. DSM 110680]|uniref:HlyD family efflux transporter periplasmic adaptor subunit n=1 Tax=Telmatobacter sp. DSM 110680 TaxID=3036704 RepID=A0AAU7DGV5_9BACT